MVYLTENRIPYVNDTKFIGRSTTVTKKSCLKSVTVTPPVRKSTENDALVIDKNVQIIQIFLGYQSTCCTLNSCDRS